MPVTVPCGQCIGCRLERSRQWAIRCTHEVSLHEKNCFITLTYAPEYLPKGGTLVKKHFQDFMKRLRFFNGSGIRYFHCGEYGEKTQRPHYHALLFNFDFSDKILDPLDRRPEFLRQQNPTYISAHLSDLWPFGRSNIGTATFESAAYVARYITKKVTGKNAIDHYNEIDYNTGEILNEKIPEYITMSRRPGIGHNWFKQYTSDVFPGDYVVLRGKKMKPPKYYDTQYEILDPRHFKKIKQNRLASAEKHCNNNTSDRLLVREEIQYEKFKLLKRNYENE